MAAPMSILWAGYFVKKFSKCSPAVQLYGKITSFSHKAVSVEYFRKWSCPQSHVRRRQISNIYLGLVSLGSHHSGPALSSKFEGAVGYQNHQKQHSQLPVSGVNEDTSQNDSSAKSKRLSLAVVMWASIFGFMKKEEPQEDPLIWSLKEAKFAELKHDYPAADKCYHKALEILKKREKTWEKDRVVEAQVHIYDSMANLAMAMNELDNAEKLFKETMRGLLQKGHSKEDDAIIEISLKLAMIYAMQEKYEEATNGYNFCIETQEKKINEQGDNVDENSLALLGMCINSYSRFMIVRNKLDEAEMSVRKTLIIALRVFGEMHPMVAVLYNDLATVLSLSNQYDVAKKHASNAIRIAKATESTDLPTFYCNLCAICIETRELKEAKRLCNEALNLAKKYGDEVALSEAQECMKEIKEKEKK